MPRMLPTFVIGLREGVEAALIVGIIAAFLARRARRDAPALGVGRRRRGRRSASAVGVALELVDQELPQRQQEMLETVIGLLAVGIVTFMIFWMRRHAPADRRPARERGGRPEPGSVWALVGMAFFAVLREGIETAVFLLAAFQSVDDPTTAGIGAVLGIAVALAIGYGDLPRRRPAQPRPVLPRHRRRPRPRRRRPARGRAAHRPRGGLDQRRPGRRRSTSPGSSSPGPGPRRF